MSPFTSKGGNQQRMSDERVPWWEDMDRCHGRTKDGRRCRRPTRRPYEIGPRNLVIPLTCHLHADQEREVRRRAAEVLSLPVSYWEARGKK